MKKIYKYIGRFTENELTDEIYKYFEERNIVIEKFYHKFNLIILSSEVLIDDIQYVDSLELEKTFYKAIDGESE